MVNGKRVDIPRYSPEDYPRFSPYNAISIRGIHVGVDCLEFEMPDRPAAKNTGFVKLEATVKKNEQTGDKMMTLNGKWINIPVSDI